MNKKGFKVGDRFLHKNHGEVVFTEECAEMEKTNPDPSSVPMFVISEKDIMELSVACLRHKQRILIERSYEESEVDNKARINFVLGDKSEIRISLNQYEDCIEVNCHPGRIVIHPQVTNVVRIYTGDI
jgi:hypothetical protein